MENQKSLCLAFAHYEKAFNSVETNVILASLELQGIEWRYIVTLAEIQNAGSNNITHRGMEFQFAKEYDMVIHYLNYSQHILQP